MNSRWQILNPAVAAFVAVLAVAPVQAQDSADLDSLLLDLRNPEAENWQRIERQIFRAWSRSGSPSADLLLQRGRDAMARGDSKAAIEHFTAAIDHAPDFAEAWHARATAWFMTKQYGPALSDLAETVARNPDHFAALIGIARILEEMERYDDARRTLYAVQAIHPHRRDVSDALQRLDRRLNGYTL
jgi:tetratricopeptide (TPR) repeat protein